MFNAKSRLPLAGVLLGGVLLIGGLFATLGWDRTWRVWNVQVAVLKFFDAQVVAAGASSYAAGADPLRENPFDLGKRPMNYPRVWQRLFDLGLRQEHAEALGWSFAVLLLAGVWIALPPLSWGEAAGVGLAVFSPAVLLGVERGNTDLAVFFVLAVALAVPRAAWNATWVTVAFALKLFPLAALALLLGRPRREALLGGAAVGAFAVAYVVWNLEDLRAISAATPRDTWLSYGLNVLPMRLAERAGPAVGLGATALAWSAVVLVILTGWRARERLPATSANPPNDASALDAFRVGAACYLGTFMLGNNFIYRLVFLLPALPQLWRWMRADFPGRREAGIGLAAALVALWTLGFDRASGVVRRDEWLWFGVSQAAHWTAFVVLGRLFIRSLPDWRSDPSRGV